MMLGELFTTGEKTPAFCAQTLELSLAFSESEGGVNDFLSVKVSLHRAELH